MPNNTVRVYDAGIRRILILDRKGRPIGTLLGPEDARFGGARGGRARSEGGSGQSRRDGRASPTSDWTTPEHLPPFETENVHMSPAGERGFAAACP